MQKFSEFIKEHKTLLENNAKASKVEEFTTLYEAKLKELGAKSLMDLDEEQMEKFNTYVKSLKEEISKGDIKKMVKDETKDLEKKVEKAVHAVQGHERRPAQCVKCGTRTQKLAARGILE